MDPGAYRLADAKTGANLLVVPIELYGTERQALSVAGRQARRHAAAGTLVLLTGPQTVLLYSGDRLFVLCRQCRGWMEPRRRGNTCLDCRLTAAQTAPAEPIPSGSKPRRRRSLRKGKSSPHQLTLPNLDEIPA